MALAAALALIAVVTLVPASGGGVRLPFWCLRCGARPWVDTLLNVLLFVPLGAALQASRTGARRAVLAVLATTVLVEALQATVVPGRFASARDIATNAAGGVFGYLLLLAWPALAFPPPRRARALAIVAIATWLATQAFTAWALVAQVPPAPWWAQIRLHDRSFATVFRGEVVRLAVGDVPVVASDEIEDPGPVRDAVRRGAPLHVVLARVQPSSGPAPIFALAIRGELSEVVLVGQDGRDAFFRVRTRAAELGFRNPALRLRDAFPAAGEPVALTARYAAGRYQLRADEGGRARERMLAASASWAWVLLMPVRQYAMGEEARWLTALWLFVLLLPAGYWAACARTDDTAGRRGHMPLFLLGGLLGLGLGLAPLACGLPLAHPSEWGAATAGLLAGGGAAMAARRVGRARPARARPSRPA